MKIGRILSPVHSLGPGERVCLWTQGCGKKCKGCISPELQPVTGDDVKETDLAQILGMVADNNNCSGLTVSGGDPFEQAASLLDLLKILRDRFDDILVYTGYEYKEIMEERAGKEGIECLKYIDVLIDGRYIRELNDPKCVLRGSANQKIVYLNEDKRETYEEYMLKGRIVESFCHNDETIITGILSEVD